MSTKKLPVEQFVKEQLKKWKRMHAEKDRKKEERIPVITLSSEPGSGLFEENQNAGPLSDNPSMPKLQIPTITILPLTPAQKRSILPQRQSSGLSGSERTVQVERLRKLYAH